MGIPPWIGLLVLAVLLRDVNSAVAQDTHVPHASARIVGGQAAADGRYPYAVSLIRASGRLFCGGKSACCGSW
jgi:secreted trypsin-like serine protease